MAAAVVTVKVLMSLAFQSQVLCKLTSSNLALPAAPGSAICWEDLSLQTHERL